MENEICWNCGIPYDVDRFSYRCPDCRADLHGVNYYGEEVPDLGTSIKINWDFLREQTQADLNASFRDMLVTGVSTADTVDVHSDNFDYVIANPNSPTMWQSRYQQQFDAYGQAIQQLNTELRRPNSWVVGIDPYINPVDNTQNENPNITNDGNDVAL